MDEARIDARFDWLAELGGALASALAAGFAVFKLAPSFGIAPAAAMTAAGLPAFGLGLLAMQKVKPEPREYALAGFGIEPIDSGELLLDVIAEAPLLLDVPYEEPMLLDDPLVADPDSRVVQLFASMPIPTPGQLKDQIDRHLTTGSMHVVREHGGPAPDASDALYAALAELRRSLR